MPGSRKPHSKGRKTKKNCHKGGSLGALFNQAIVPFALLGLNQKYGSRRKRSSTKKRRTKRRR